MTMPTPEASPEPLPAAAPEPIEAPVAGALAGVVPPADEASAGRSEAESGSGSGSEPTPAAAEPTTDGRRLAILIDASGSTIDSMPRMIGHVGRIMDGLRGDDQFTVLFYRAGEAIEALSPGLKPAEPRLKRRVWDWMQPEEEHVIAGGRSDAAVAIQLALSYGADELVILSDNTFGGRRTTTEEVLEALSLVIGRRQVKIDTVQFFYRDADQTLRELADAYDGEFEFIKSEPTIEGPDPLQVLSGEGDAS